jgi:hypothetical protein
VSREQARRGALEALDRILNRGGDADDVLRGAVDALAPLYDAVAIEFVEGAGLLPGPSRGEPGGGGATLPIRFEGVEVARLTVAPAHDDDAGFLDRVATLVSPYCLVGWDTGGEPWEP